MSAAYSSAALRGVGWERLSGRPPQLRRRGGAGGLDPGWSAGAWSQMGGRCRYPRGGGDEAMPRASAAPPPSGGQSPNSLAPWGAVCPAGEEGHAVFSDGLARGTAKPLAGIRHLPRLSLWGCLASLWVLTGPAAALREDRRCTDLVVSCCRFSGSLHASRRPHPECGMLRESTTLHGTLRRR